MALVLAWKPAGLTSSNFVHALQKEYGWPRSKRGSGVGHSGTLDPFAEGLMLIGAGEGTKILAAFDKSIKTYIADFCFNYSSDTLDIYGTLNQNQLNFKGDFDRQTFLNSQIKKQMQVPPNYSAVHIGGKRAYDLARKGEHFEIPPKEIEVFSATDMGVLDWGASQSDGGPATLKTLGADFSGLKIWRVKITVSSGTYIRSFARDWGLKLFNHAGVLSRLKRVGFSKFQELVEPMPLKFLSKEDLFAQGICQEICIDPQEYSLFLSQGVFAPRSGITTKAPCLIVDAQSTPLGWAIDPSLGKVQRRFLSDPFENVSKSDQKKLMEKQKSD